MRLRFRELPVSGERLEEGQVLIPTEPLAPCFCERLNSVEPAAPSQFGSQLVGPFFGFTPHARMRQFRRDSFGGRHRDVVALRVEGPNKAGAAYQITRRLADAGINLRGVSASVIGKTFQLFLAFDNAADADNAARSLRAGGGKKS